MVYLKHLDQMFLWGTGNGPDQRIAILVGSVGGFQIAMFGIAPGHLEVIVHVHCLDQVVVAECFEDRNRIAPPDAKRNQVVSDHPGQVEIFESSVLHYSTHPVKGVVSLIVRSSSGIQRREPQLQRSEPRFLRPIGRARVFTALRQDSLALAT